MASGSSVGDWFEQGRPSPRSLEIDQVLGSLRERFGVGEAAPVKLGRYRVAGRIGAGGLGLVYRAYDPSLARFVAIKVLKAGQRLLDDSSANEARLLREAQVLARIRHPHVVEVFDVGFFEDHGVTRFFVAMELVEGTDLRHWLAAAPSFAAIREAFVAAAQGLHAAHEQGLLHRDFKPSNVLMGNDGAVKVADFGLAAVTEELRAELDTPRRIELDGVATPSWRPGGTPHYMSPEQQRGEPLTPASDQYGFCVSLYEAVYGRRPFDAPDREALLAAKLQGPPLPRDREVPGALRTVLARGLQAAPEDRFETMAQLREALRQVRVAPRPWLWVALGATVVTAGAVTLAPTEEPPPVSNRCPIAPASFERVGATPSTALGVLLGQSPPLARTWPAIAGALDDYGAELQQRWDRACTLDAGQQAQVHRCLERSGEGLSELRELFAKGARDTMIQGWALVRELPEFDTCAPDPDSGDAMPRGEWLAVIARARLLGTAGYSELARTKLEELRPQLVAQGATHAARRIDIEMAEQLMLEGRYDDALAGLEACYFGAVAEGDTTAAARAAVRLVAQGSRSGDVESALAWARTSRTALELMQPRDLDLLVVLEHNLAMTHLAAGDLPLALERIVEAERWSTEPGISPDLRAATLQVHAELLLHAGRPAQSLRLHQGLAEIREQLPGHDLLTVVIEEQSRGNALATLHDVAGALSAYTEAYAQATAALGSDHPQTSSACIALARAQGDAGHMVEGLEILAPCLQRLEHSLGEGHPHVVVARAIWGRLARQSGDWTTAREQLRGSLAALEEAFGDAHYAVADVLDELGRMYAAQGEHALARVRFERSLAIQRAAFPDKTHLKVAEINAQLAALDIAQGQPARARTTLRDAIVVFEAQQLHPDYIAEWTALHDGLDTSTVPPSDRVGEPE